MSSFLSKDLKKKIFIYGKKSIKVLSATADILISIEKNKSSPLNILAFSSRFMSSCDKVFSDLSENDNLFDGWNYVEMDENFSSAFRKFLTSHIDCKQQSGKTWSYTIIPLNQDIIIGYVDRVYYEGFYHPPDINIQDIYNALANIFESKLGKNLLLTSAKARYGNVLMVSNDNLKDFKPSLLGKKIYEQDIIPFLNSGKNRSILFHGEPGTGKTYMMKYIADLMNKRILRIFASSLDDIKNFQTYCDILQPEIIIIDDLDRYRLKIELFDEIRKTVPLVMASANDITVFDSAILRPERFDKLIEIQKLDQDTINKILNDISSNFRERLSVLPIAYISEFVNLQKYYSKKQLEIALEELEIRAYTIEEGFKKNKSEV